MNVTMTASFAAIAITMYAMHHVGDYWVQTERQAKGKGLPGIAGDLWCFMHVWTYGITQVAGLALLAWVTGVEISDVGGSAGMAVSMVTHYMADRREHGPMLWLARAMPWKRGFVDFGAPRDGVSIDRYVPCSECDGKGVQADGACHACQAFGRMVVETGDNPMLATGAWALDQSWHIFWGVFVASLLMAYL